MFSEAGLQKTNELDKATRLRIKADFDDLGVSNCPDGIIDHLAVLESNTRFNGDSREVQRGVERVFDAFEEKGPFLKLSSEEKQKFLLASYIADIGKSSASEDPDCRLAVARLFSLNDIDLTKTVEDTLLIHFEKESKKMLSGLKMIGVNSDITMRQFFDKHAFWTKEILERFPNVFDEDTREIAVSHHIDRNINPYGIDENKMPERKKYQIYTLMIVDKYQARRYRIKKKHSEAMLYLKEDLIEKGGERKKYFDNPIIVAILDKVDELGVTGSLFLEKGIKG